MIPVQANRLKITHITGLGFKEGEDLRIDREGNLLMFQGKVEKIWEELAGGIRITKKSMEDQTVKLNIKEIEGLDVIDESGRSLGKAFVGGALGTLVLGPIGLIAGGFLGARKRSKSFIIIQIKSEDKPAYQIVLGGEKQREVRKKYDDLLKLIQQ